MRPALFRRDFAAAAAAVEAGRETTYGDGARLLYLMDRGSVGQLAGDVAGARQAFRAASALAEALWTEEVSAHAAAWLTTDNALPYQGEDFEHVLVHVLAALNEVAGGALGAARVEARQVTGLLARLATRIDGPPGAYRDDGLARWLSGRLAEAEAGVDRGAWGDAWIDYRLAIDLYAGDYGGRVGAGPPLPLLAAALRALDGLGVDFAPERTALLRAYPGVGRVAEAEAEAEAGPSGARARAVFVHLGGEAPYKVDAGWTVVVDGAPVRVAYPMFVRRPAQIVAARVHLPDGGEVVAAPMADLAALAVTNLADHVGRVRAKAVARATAKWLATHAARRGAEARGDATGDAVAVAMQLLQIGQAVAEEADKRSWLTLPASVAVADVPVPAGASCLAVDFVDARGAVVERARLAVRAPPGGTAFATYRTFR